MRHRRVANSQAIVSIPAATATCQRLPCVVSSKKSGRRFQRLQSSSRSSRVDQVESASRTLQIELKILRVVGTGEHPNIIDLHGIGISHLLESSNKGISFDLSFLVLGRIQCSIQQMLGKWREQMGLLFSDQESTRELWLERMTVLVQVADAVAHLHSKRFIKRDFKT